MFSFVYYQVLQIYSWLNALSFVFKHRVDSWPRQKAKIKKGMINDQKILLASGGLRGERARSAPPAKNHDSHQNPIYSDHSSIRYGVNYGVSSNVPQ